MVLKSTKTQALKDNAASAAELATSLAKDKKFRKQLLSAVGHGATARGAPRAASASSQPLPGSAQTRRSGVSSAR